MKSLICSHFGFSNGSRRILFLSSFLVFFPQEIFDCFLKGADFGLFPSSSDLIEEQWGTEFNLWFACVQSLCPKSVQCLSVQLITAFSCSTYIYVKLQYPFFFLSFSFSAAPSKPQVILQQQCYLSIDSD